MDSPDTAVYDRIGTSYTAKRKADPRWETDIHAALGAARTVIDVGAGTGPFLPARY